MEIFLSSHGAEIYSVASNKENIFIMPFILSDKALMKKKNIVILTNVRISLIPKKNE